MRPRELDFRHPIPPRPVLAWLILAAGVLMGLFALSRYQTASQDMEQAQQAMAHGKPTPRVRVARAAQSGPDPYAVLMRRDWNALLNGLEGSLSADIHLLELEVDGRKGLINLHAETAHTQAMLGYLQGLRDQGHVNASLRNHASTQADNSDAASAPVRFVIQIPWGQP